ncbi:MAG: hypothetical protein AAFU77_16520 [Myxococcota bacterium]
MRPFSGGRSDRFYERVRNPVLTNVEVDWAGLPVEDTTPEITPDLFSGQPLLIHGRYLASARGTVTVRGEYGGRAFEQRIPVALPGLETLCGKQTRN